jgi:CRISPR/Cas system-associated endonuclease/helicase Cas3
LLNNSILIIDEIQDFNKENLYFLKFFLEQIVPNHNIKIILSSATLPKFIYDELKEEDYFFYNYYNNTNDIKLENEKYFNRIKLELLTESKIDILHDINDISYNINNETLYDLIDKKIRNNKRILFINHTIDASEKL